MKSIPYSIASGSGITANGSISCFEVGGLTVLHFDFSGGKLTDWTQVATGVPLPAPGFGYHAVAPPDFGGYSPAKIRITGGKMEVRASSGTFMADAAIVYPTAS